MPKLAARALTAAIVKKASPPAKLPAGGGAKGLVLRIYTSGSATWWLTYRYLGRQRHLSLGEYPGLSIADARIEAGRIRAAVKDGRDPAAERKRTEAQARQQHRDSVAALYELFEPVFRRDKRPATAREYDRIYRKEIAPRWADRPVKSITPRDVSALTAEKAKTHRVMANRVQSFAINLLSFARNIGWLDQNLSLGLRKPGGTEKTRERVLTDDELRALWAALDETVPEKPDAPRLRPVLADLLRFQLLTGQRLRETAITRWENVNTDEGVWRIPAADNKAKRDHTVPLTPQALAVLHRRRAETPAREPYVFRGTKTGTTIHSTATGIVAWLCRERLSFKFTDHDLRRTVKTQMIRAGVSEDVADRALNHKPASMTRVASTYNRWGYEPERRAAFEAWHALLAQILDKTLPAVDPVAEARDEGRAEANASWIEGFRMLAQALKQQDRSSAE